MKENLYIIEGEEDYQKGLLFFNGNAETLIDIRKAFEYFNKAANVGHPEAKYHVGYLYLYGEPYILKNECRAMQCLKEAADEGIGLAQFYCGIGYFLGNGIEKDINVGIDYLKSRLNKDIILLLISYQKYI